MKLEYFNKVIGNNSRIAPRDDCPHLAGFTMIELLVVMAVTALLSAMVILYSSASRRQITLSIETARMVQVINRAKALTLGVFLAAPPAPCGYGLRFDYPGRRYSLFSYSAENCEAVNEINPASEKIAETYQLNPEIKLEALVSSPEAFIFVAPNPRLVFSPISFSEGDIILKTRDDLASTTITLNFGGQVSVR